MDENGRVFWDRCPSEILTMILSRLDGYSLLQCLAVNRRWRDIAEYLGQICERWPDMGPHGIENRGVAFRRKSMLEWSHLFDNSLSWNKVHKAQLTEMKVYSDIGNIIRINVSRDKLIVVSKEVVEYYGLEINNPRRKFIQAYTDFDESEHVILKAVKDGPFKTLLLYGKRNPRSFDFDEGNEIVHRSILLYKLEDMNCFTLDHQHVLRLLRWIFNRWQVTELGRYYGIGGIVDMHIHGNALDLMMAWGAVLRYRPMFKTFGQWSAVDPPPIEGPDPVMFRCRKYPGLVVGVRLDEPWRLRFKPGNCGGGVLECNGLTSAIRHAHVLILGFQDGQVAICLANRLTRRNSAPAREFNVRDLKLYAHEDPAIVSVNVYESYQSQLLIATERNVYRVKLDYPDAPPKLWRLKGKRPLKGISQNLQKFRFNYNQPSTSAQYRARFGSEALAYSWGWDGSSCESPYLENMSALQAAFFESAFLVTSSTQSKTSLESPSLESPSTSNAASLERSSLENRSALAGASLQSPSVDNYLAPVMFDSQVLRGVRLVGQPVKKVTQEPESPPLDDVQPSTSALKEESLESPSQEDPSTLEDIFLESLFLEGPSLEDDLEDDSPASFLLESTPPESPSAESPPLIDDVPENQGTNLSSRNSSIIIPKRFNS